MKTVTKSLIVFPLERQKSRDTVENSTTDVVVPPEIPVLKIPICKQSWILTGMTGSTPTQGYMAKSTSWQCNQLIHILVYSELTFNPRDVL